VPALAVACLPAPGAGGCHCTVVPARLHFACLRSWVSPAGLLITVAFCCSLPFDTLMRYRFVLVAFQLCLRLLPRCCIRWIMGLLFSSLFVDSGGPLGSGCCVARCHRFYGFVLRYALFVVRCRLRWFGLFRHRVCLFVYVAAAILLPLFRYGLPIWLLFRSTLNMAAGVVVLVLVGCAVTAFLYYLLPLRVYVYRCVRSGLVFCVVPLRYTGLHHVTTLRLDWTLQFCPVFNRSAVTARCSAVYCHHCVQRVTLFRCRCVLGWITDDFCYRWLRCITNVVLPSLPAFALTFVRAVVRYFVGLFVRFRLCRLFVLPFVLVVVQQTVTCSGFVRSALVRRCVIGCSLICC